MSIDKNILDKYSTTQEKVTEVKELITEIIFSESGVKVKKNQIDIQKNVVSLLVSSIKRFIILEKIIEIEGMLSKKNIQPHKVQ